MIEARCNPPVYLCWRVRAYVPVLLPVLALALVLVLAQACTQASDVGVGDIDKDDGPRGGGRTPRGGEEYAGW